MLRGGFSFAACGGGGPGETQEHPMPHPLDGPKHVGRLALRALPSHAEERTKSTVHRGALETQTSPWSRRMLEPILHQLRAGKRGLGSTLRVFLASDWLLVEMCTLTKPDPHHPNSGVL